MFTNSYTSQAEWFVIIAVPTFIILVIVCILGGITLHINKSKGYKGGFAWGFFLGIIGIIVVACRPYNPNRESNTPAVQNPIRLIHCYNCGEEIPEELAFCSKCGAQIKKRCDYCGIEVPFNSNFCYKCGKSFKLQ